MADKQWYIKVGGTQQGPYSEAELRDLIARTEISADTLVWRNPMPEWGIDGRFSQSDAFIHPHRL